MGVHGRERVIRMTTLALILAFVLASPSAQSPAPFQDLAGELASRIAARLPAGRPVALAAEDGTDLDDVRGEIARGLTMRGFHIAEGGVQAALVRFACFENIRERGCAAEIRNGDARDEVAVTRPIESQHRRTSPLSLDVRPLFGQRTQMLDAVVVGDRLLVLDPDFVTLYRSGDGGWQRVQARRIETARTWPRDVRGRIHVGPDSSVRILLPAVTCRSTVDLANVACVEEREAWPLDIDNGGLDGMRNFFSTPEGLPFFSAAALDPTAGARWIVAALSGELTFLDASRRSIGRGPAGDEVAALKPSCAAETVILVSSSREQRRDVLRLFRASRRELLPAAAPLELAGQLTALWSDTRGGATGIVRSESGQRYDAFHISVACDR